jgi:hypothetical protein
MYVLRTSAALKVGGHGQILIAQSPTYLLFSLEGILRLRSPKTLQRT